MYILKITGFWQLVLKLDLSCSSCNFTERNNLTSADVTSFTSYLVLYPFAHLASDQCKYCNYYINAYEKLSVKTDQYKMKLKNSLTLDHSV